MSARARVTLKLATSLDARIALASGASKWITGPEARARVHEMRAAHDAILTGIGTVLADDPRLTARLDAGAPAQQPVRAVLDTSLRTPPGCALLKEGPAVLFHGAHAPPSGALLAAGARCVALPLHEERVDIAAALDWLAGEGCRSVMIEAGGKVAASALALGRVDRIEWFRAPVLLGGDGMAAIAGLGLETLDAAPIFQRTRVIECGADVLERWERV
ncbi:RibD family protein [Alkalicaulis satelles]|uniref:RibD family protein n=1 Tax=Alkalicaulis satelles TaxID=2609175 RepID=A0A5M6ZNC1_9PROT|nr:RibD family protein [Alkalicaulis satelles]KAA5805084.1 RibD family protein [Alkalicaulis satelles]